MAKVALRYTCTIAPAHMGLVEKELLRHLIQKIKSLNAPSPMRPQWSKNIWRQPFHDKLRHLLACRLGKLNFRLQARATDGATDGATGIPSAQRLNWLGLAGDGLSIPEQ